MSGINYFQSNFATVVSSFGLIILLVFNRGAKQRIKKLMFLSAVAVLLLSVADYVDVAVSYEMDLLGLRMVASIVGYILRPAPLYLMALCVLKHKKRNYFFAIPLVINAVILLINPFTEVVFRFNELGSFERGVLGYVPHIVGIFYMVLVGYCALRMFYDKYINEGLILLFMEIMAIIAILMETFSPDKIYVSTAYAIFNILYYVFNHVQIFSKDQLTGLLNRASFYEDCRRYRGNISGLISIDMNELKWINDNYGHAEGDKAIKTVTKCLSEAFGRKFPVYRMGGDEFTVIIWEGNEKETDDKISLCRQLLEKSDRSCAFGTAYYDRGSGDEIDINKLLKEADEEMYSDKMRIKQSAVVGKRKLHMRD